MKTLKNIFFALLIVGFILPLFSKEALAAEIPSVNDTGDSFTETTITYVNPLYADVIDESDLKEPSDISTCAVSQYETSIEDAAAYVREQMKNRQETIEVGLQTSSEEELKVLSQTIYQTAIKHTGVPTEGDYLFPIRRIQMPNKFKQSKRCALYHLCLYNDILFNSRTGSRSRYCC